MYHLGATKPIPTQLGTMMEGITPNILDIKVALKIVVLVAVIEKNLLLLI